MKELKIIKDVYIWKSGFRSCLRHYDCGQMHTLLKMGLRWKKFYVKDKKEWSSNKTQHDIGHPIMDCEEKLEISCHGQMKMKLPYGCGSK